MDLEPTYSETAAEGMFRRGLAGRLTPAVQEELKQVGIDLGRPLLAAYPQAAWERGVQVVVTRLFSDLPPEQGYFQVGRLYIRGFEATLLGKAVVQLSRIIGPERTLSRMQRNQRTTANFSDLQVEKVAATHFRIHSATGAEFLPRATDTLGTHAGDLVSGIYLGVLELLAVKNPKSTFRVVDAARYAYDYDLTWDP